MKIKSLLAGFMMMALVPFGSAIAAGTVTFLQVTPGFYLIGLSDGSACGGYQDDAMAIGAVLMSAFQNGGEVTLECFTGGVPRISSPL